MSVLYEYIVILTFLCLYSGSSSSGSNSVPHSFSVDEIQKTRSKLKSSKSYPDDFFKKQTGPSGDIAETVEDGDNSSSGVSSDQEITNVSNSDYQSNTDQSSLRLQRPQASKCIPIESSSAFFPIH